MYFEKYSLKGLVVNMFKEKRRLKGIVIKNGFVSKIDKWNINKVQGTFVIVDEREQVIYLFSENSDTESKFKGSSIANHLKWKLFGGAAKIKQSKPNKLEDAEWEEFNIDISEFH